MGKVCEICGKRSKTGNSKSHSNVKTRRVWKPNIQTILADIEGKRRRINVCTKCLKAGKVKKATPIVAEKI
ncbi:MAG: 50S ribosomal protein L28 [Candidatus Omnitrophica bacterium]|nr:50S ribosomal protein L28 [Candidatus Omnitrophota bacterium]MCM8776656.1 50S ribosomal protein L28 [Candidatus Omnitrophota bacterium]